MKGKFFLLVSVLTCCCSFSSNYDKIAWIEERFANCIIDSGIIHREYLFPIEGFERIQGDLYILTNGGELNRVQSKLTDEGNLITNFEYLVNLQVWPKWMVEKYAKSQLYYIIEEDKIKLTVESDHITESYVFITDIRGSHFGSILEIKGWLLDVLIGNQNQYTKGIRIGDKITEGTDTLISK